MMIPLSTYAFQGEGLSQIIGAPLQLFPYMIFFHPASPSITWRDRSLWSRPSAWKTGSLLTTFQLLLPAYVSSCQHLKVSTYCQQIFSLPECFGRLWKCCLGVWSLRAMCFSGSHMCLTTTIENGLSNLVLFQSLVTRKGRDGHPDARAISNYQEEGRRVTPYFWTLNERRGRGGQNPTTPNTIQHASGPWSENPQTGLSIKTLFERLS